MQAELAYYGKFGNLAYLDSIPWGHFRWFHKWLSDVKKQEAEEQKKAQMAQQQAMASAKASSRPVSRPIPRGGRR